jgi:hypothetical protein
MFESAALVRTCKPDDRRGNSTRGGFPLPRVLGGCRKGVAMANYTEASGPRLIPVVIQEIASDGSTIRTHTPGSIHHVVERSEDLCRILEYRAATAGDKVAETFWRERKQEFNNIGDDTLRGDWSVEGEPWRIAAGFDHLSRKRFVVEAAHAGYSLIERDQMMVARVRLERLRNGSGSTDVMAINCWLDRLRDEGLGFELMMVPAGALGRDAPVEMPITLPSLDVRKAERRALRDTYKSECRTHGVKLTHPMIAEAAHKGWKSRTTIDKWLACDARYNGEIDRLIRNVFIRKPHIKPKP